VTVRSVMLIWLIILFFFYTNLVDNSIHIIARNEFFDGDLKHWINVNMNVGTDLYANVEWRCFWATACQQIWYRRNKEHHDKWYVRPIHLVLYIYIYIYIYVRPGQRLVYDSLNIIKVVQKSLVHMKWIPPSVGWAKLNTDGSCKERKYNLGRLNQNSRKIKQTI
jgi:hypothetical protein